VAKLKLSAPQHHKLGGVESEITAVPQFWMKLAGQLRASAAFPARKYTVSIGS
jgi:hypothetical protein